MPAPFDTEPTSGGSPRGRVEDWVRFEMPNTSRFDDVRFFDELDSTNRYLVEEASLGATEGTVAVARHQTAGRGRRERTWLAEPDSSLLMSVLVRPNLPPNRYFSITAALALAGCDASEKFGVTPTIKWPNDLLVGEHKLAGVLAQAFDAGGESTIVAGIGLNLRPLPSDSGAAASATSLEQHRPPGSPALTPGDLIAPVLEHFEENYLQALDAPAVLMARYRQRCATLGREVRVTLMRGSIEGRAQDVDDSGALLVRQADGRQTAVTVGDTVHLRPS
ncbi:MAG: biotin--[acetyl-CoA-carboxylase] ligase [Acidimicrobiia bacterium]|nr:biotin--[acetyl-CoA-carboxylase] ligase [Acidimicrobiia bacterium]